LRQKRPFTEARQNLGTEWPGQLFAPTPLALSAKRKRFGPTPAGELVGPDSSGECSRLGYLLNGAGFFHQAHTAVDDCHALLEILACELPTTGTSALAVLLERARKKTMRVWAEQSPFDLKDPLKRRG
jgi:hypothetical protein